MHSTKVRSRITTALLVCGVGGPILQVMTSGREFGSGLRSLRVGLKVTLLDPNPSNPTAPHPRRKMSTRGFVNMQTREWKDGIISKAFVVEFREFRV